MKPAHIKHLQAVSRTLDVKWLKDYVLAVESRSNPLFNHIITVEFRPNDHIHARCTCDWARNRGTACVHVMAALDHLALRKGRSLSFWLTHEDAERQKHRTFYLEGSADEDGIWITSRPA